MGMGTSLEGRHPRQGTPFHLVPGALQAHLGLDWTQNQETGTFHPPLRFDFGPIGVASKSVAERIASRFDLVISLGTDDDFPPSFLADHPNRLQVRFDDVTMLTPASAARSKRLILPSDVHVRQILAAIRPDRTTLIHCYGGVSRSPAAAILALLHLGADLQAILASADPTRLDPNDLLLQAGERVLGLPQWSITGPVQAWWEQGQEPLPEGDGSFEL